MTIYPKDLTDNGRAETRLIDAQRAMRIREENRQRTAAAIVARRESMRASLR